MTKRVFKSVVSICTRGLAWFANRDWRLRFTVYSYLVSVAVTVLIYLIEIRGNANTALGDPAKFWGAVFAGWVSGLLIFTVIGGAAAIGSFVRPEEEEFDARARILFKRQSGKHIDYIVKKMQSVFEHYSEFHGEVMVIEEFDAPTQRYRIVSDSETVIRSYIDDIDTDYSIHLALNEATTTPPPGRQPNRLSFLRIDGQPACGAEDMATDKFSKEVHTTVPRRTARTITNRFDIWAQADTEPNTFRPVRYTQEFTLEVANHTSDPVIIHLSTDEGVSFDDHVLVSGERTILVRAKDVEPMVEMFDFRVRPA